VNDSQQTLNSKLSYLKVLSEGEGKLINKEKRILSNESTQRANLPLNSNNKN